MGKRLQELARLVKGEIVGDEDLKIRGAGGIDACEKGEITFAEKTEYLKQAIDSPASAIITLQDVDSEILVGGKKAGKSFILVDNPRLAYARIAKLFVTNPYYRPGIAADAIVADDVKLGEYVSIHPLAVIEEGVEIGRGSIIGPGVFIGRGCKLGSEVTLYPHVVVEHGTIIGNRVIIQAGSIIGSEGFGYVSDEEGHHKIPQQGRVIIEDDVEIGALVAVDRGASGQTRIRRGTKIDNLVQIAHGVDVGEEVLIVAQTGIAGSSRLGRRVTLAGRAGVLDHVELTDEVTLGAGSIATKDIHEPGVYSGYPAQLLRKDMRAKAALKRLPHYLKKIAQLEQELNDLKELLGLGQD